MRVLTAMPVFNEERYLDSILPAVLEHADHVLAVDDGSSDQTAAILDRYPAIQVIRHDRNLGYGAALRSAFDACLAQGFDGLVTIDCDGQHEPQRIPEIIAGLDSAEIVSGSRYLQVFDARQQPPLERRRINREVTRWLNDCLGLFLTDAFCGFKAYRRSALECFEISENGYAMPLEVWVQAARHGLSIVEIAVPLIYLDESRAFGGSLDDAGFRLNHYREVFRSSLARAGMDAARGCC